MRQTLTWTPLLPVTPSLTLRQKPCQSQGRNSQPHALKAELLAPTWSRSMVLFSSGAS